MSSIRSSIIIAITTMRLIELEYKGSSRLLEPHRFGELTSGQLALSAWQISGGSGSGFRTFLLEEIDAATVRDDDFAECRIGYSASDSKFRSVIAQL